MQMTEERLKEWESSKAQAVWYDENPETMSYADLRELTDEIRRLQKENKELRATVDTLNAEIKIYLGSKAQRIFPEY